MGYVIKRGFVTISQACVVIGVSRRSIYAWLQTGKLAYFRTPGGSVRIFTESLIIPADETPLEDARRRAQGRANRQRTAGTSLAYRMSQRSRGLVP